MTFMTINGAPPRYGKFKIYYEEMTNPKIRHRIPALFGHTIILATELNAKEDQTYFIYHAYSDHFRTLSWGDPIPEYSFIVNEIHDEMQVTFKEIVPEAK